MPLALFDLDNTLLAGDSDYEWGVFLVNKGLVDGDIYREANEKFYRQYANGELDIHEFLNFSLGPLAIIEPATLASLHDEFMEKHIRAMMTRTGIRRVVQHRDAGDITLIITATNSFVTAPIASAFGVDHLIATEPEIIDGRYTGKVAGVPSFQHGKITRLEAWMSEHGTSLAGSTFYSDSHNDLPLLERVDTPVAVDPDDILRQTATERGWTIESFKAADHLL